MKSKTKVLVFFISNRTNKAFLFFLIFRDFYNKHFYGILKKQYDKEVIK